MENESNFVSLKNLGRGAAIEKFDEEFSRVLENIVDPNTSPTAAREITLSVTLKPNDARDFVTVSVNCKSKLSADKAFTTQMFVGVDLAHGGRRVVATEHNPQQMGISFQPSPGVKLARQIEKGGEEE